MNPTAKNPNMTRRSGPGMLARIAAPLLKPWLRLLRRSTPSDPQTLTVFQSYMVGDLFMALPALKSLAGAFDVRVVCRPDCVEILRDEGLEGIPFDNAFFVRPGFSSFFKTLRNSWNLRKRIGTLALDFDADPRTAFWMKIAGTATMISYSRPYAVFFDDLFSIPGDVMHQADKNNAVASEFLARFRKSTNLKPAAARSSASPVPIPPPDAPWILSCRTRKDVKNWPLDRWDDFVGRMLEAGIPFRILKDPDGDAEFQAFHSRWIDRVPFMEGSLHEVSQAIRRAEGVVATDNFVGHAAAHYGRPVLWINGSSDPRQVSPRGPGTRIVQVDPMNCRPCNHHCVNPEYKACLLKLEPNAVWQTFAELRGRN